ncbi:MAG: GspH/FimT family pseudopilin [Undibacterium sp.]|nr:GspH/FimT family pseudopilin [Undibacterium sp.]
MKNRTLFHQKAFTLTELMIVIAIVAIVAGIGIPSFKDMVVTNRITRMTSELHGALLLARSEAITRGSNVVICRAVNADVLPACTNVNSNPMINTGWAEGWIIFSDGNNNGVFDAPVAPPGVSDVLIKVQGPIITDFTVGSIVPVPQRNRLVFNSTGQSFGTFMRFAVNRPDNDTTVSHDRFICVAQGGRARVSKNICSAAGG